MFLVTVNAAKPWSVDISVIIRVPKRVPRAKSDVTMPVLILDANNFVVNLVRRVSSRANESANIKNVLPAVRSHARTNLARNLVRGNCDAAILVSVSAAILVRVDVANVTAMRTCLTLCSALRMKILAMYDSIAAISLRRKVCRCG